MAPAPEHHALRAATRRRPRVQEPGFHAFVRREQLAQLGWRR